MKKAIVIPIAIAALTLLAFATTNAYRVATVEIRFIEERPAVVRTVEYTVDGLTCRGMSMTLAGQIKDVPGVVSLTTYVRTHTAVVEYDPTKTSPDEIAEAFVEPIVHEGQTYEVFKLKSQVDLD